MATLTVYANIDSWMENFGPDTNFGANPRVLHRVTYIGEVKASWARGIGNFDVSSLVGATINSAKLRRNIISVLNPGYEMQIVRCMAHPDTGPADWVEDEVTWNEYSDGNTWTTGGGDVDAVGPPAAILYNEATAAGWHEVLGLKPFVDDAIANRGNIVSIITRLNDEDPEINTLAEWWSKDQGSNIWHLEVDYTPRTDRERGLPRGLHRGLVRGD